MYGIRVFFLPTTANMHTTHVVLLGRQCVVGWQPQKYITLRWYIYYVVVVVLITFGVPGIIQITPNRHTTYKDIP